MFIFFRRTYGVKDLACPDRGDGFCPGFAQGHHAIQVHEPEDGADLSGCAAHLKLTVFFLHFLEAVQKDPATGTVHKVQRAQVEDQTGMSRQQGLDLTLEFLAVSDIQDFHGQRQHRRVVYYLDGIRNP